MRPPLPREGSDMRRRRSRATGMMARYTSDGGLTLTSMMDILTTLLFFVLKSYVTGGEITVPPPGVTLPRSSARADMRAQMDDLDRRKGHAKAAARLATIQVDEQMEFRVLQKVMYTLDRNGFP